MTSIENLYRKYNTKIILKQTFNKDNDLISEKYEDYKL